MDPDEQRSKPVEEVKVQGPNVEYGAEHVDAFFAYERNECIRDGSKIIVRPLRHRLQLRTSRRLPRLGLMLVGWGGNNGSTLTAALLAWKLGTRWETKRGTRGADWLGSLTQSSTVRLGSGPDGRDVYAPINTLLPMVKPEDLHVDGWDISSLDLEASARRAQVLDVTLQQKLGPHLRRLRPRPTVFDLDFVAANQADRADNVLTGTKTELLQRLRSDIRDFKRQRDLTQVVVMWTANTERFCSVKPGLNDTADNLMKSIDRDEKEISPSTLFAVASILEGCIYTNGSPQNTFVPGCIQLAEQHGSFLAGDDLKTGQTKLKSVLMDFLVGAGIKPTAIASYNHLGNNDGKNLSAPETFQSKEVSKSGVVNDMVESNSILYASGESPDHVVVIKYVPYVGDSKRALDEYTSEIMLGGLHTLSIHNTCEDSLLAAPLILDLVLLAELFSRVRVRGLREDNSPASDFTPLHPIMSTLSYLVKSPMNPAGAPVVNSLFRQRACIENLLRACIGLQPENNLQLEYKLASCFNDISPPL